MTVLEKAFCFFQLYTRSKGTRFFLMMIYIHRFPTRPSNDLSVFGPFGSKLLFCVHDFVQFSVCGDSELMFILSTRNAINTVV